MKDTIAACRPKITKIKALRSVLIEEWEFVPQEKIDALRVCLPVLQPVSKLMEATTLISKPIYTLNYSFVFLVYFLLSRLVYNFLFVEWWWVLMWLRGSVVVAGE